MENAGLNWKGVESKTIIEDWAGNRMFPEMDFNNFEEAEEYLAEFLDGGYEEERGEYIITIAD